MSYRLAWLTDIHLNFADSAAQLRLVDSIRRSAADSVVITGDIGEATSIEGYLSFLRCEISTPLYFVLGNHDFYGGSIREVRTGVGLLTKAQNDLVYLTGSPIVSLTPKTALVGHDGWPDGRFGDYENSEVLLNDYFMIDEFRAETLGADGIPLLPKPDRLSIMQSLAAEAKTHFEKFVPEALESHEEVIIATHVPPFREACWYQGRISNDDFLPHMSSKIVGDSLLDIMVAYPKRRMTVLCGHTHGSGDASILNNLRVLTGGATYELPCVQRILNVS